jgi:glutathione S-transferase
MPTTFLANPSFVAFAASMVVLCLNILGLWAYSGAVRGRSKTTPNAEDAQAFKTQLAGQDPPEVARVLRAHRNATDNILPFAILAFLYVLAGASPMVVAVVCGIFVVARVAHSFSYLNGKQPWRTIFFTIGGLDTLVLAGLLAKTLIAGA